MATTRSQAQKDAAAEAAASFRRFAQLPQELRLMIWKMAIVTRLATTKVARISRIPAILQACVESRRFSGYIFHPLITFHPQLDVLFLHYLSFTRPCWKLGAPLKQFLAIAPNPLMQVERLGFHSLDIDILLIKPGGLKLEVTCPNLRELVVVLEDDVKEFADLVEVEQGFEKKFLYWKLIGMSYPFEMISDLKGYFKEAKEKGVLKSDLKLVLMVKKETKNEWEDDYLFYFIEYMKKYHS